MTQNYLHYNTDLCSGKYTCISPFRRTHLSGEYLDVAVGDILVVKSRPRNATAPKSFLYGVNQTTGSEGYFPACCIDVHALGPNINPQLHVRSKSIDRLVSALSSISRPISSTNIDANISQPIVPPRNKRLLNVSSASISTVRFISQSSRSCTNLSISNQGLSLHTSEQCHGSVPTLFARCHQFQDVSVSYPRLCALCGDYVVTPRCKANRCLACKSLFHLICAEFSKRFGKSPCQSEENVKLPTTQQKTTYPNASSDIYPLSSSSVSINEQPLISWNPTQVAHWLAVVGLGRFVALFLKLNLDGSFLSKVTPDSPYLSQVIDPFAREALKQAILVLQGQNPAPGEDVSIFTKLERKKISLDKPEIIGKHDFQLTSFYRVVSCIVCNVPLLGFAHQGFQCKACGAICHRICKALDGFSDCLGNFTVLQSSVHEELSTSCESTEIPTSLVPYISDYFGVNWRIKN
ncbi:unnamed protein product [Heterobilharzia americana]|nr:unnamed protein product [Heterobilharzia americana]